VSSLERTLILARALAADHSQAPTRKIRATHFARLESFGFLHMRMKTELGRLMKAETPSATRTRRRSSHLLRRKMSETCTGVHAPPRAVAIPRAASARATPRSDYLPAATPARNHSARRKEGSGSRRSRRACSNDRYSLCSRRALHVRPARRQRCRPHLTHFR
jgi:hypothetical protein